MTTRWRGMGEVRVRMRGGDVVDRMGFDVRGGKGVGKRGGMMDVVFCGVRE